MAQIDDVLFTGDLAEEGKKQFQEPFVPPVRAKHCAPRNLMKRKGKGKRTEQVEADDDDDVIFVDASLPKKNPQRKGRGKIHSSVNSPWI